MAVITNGTAILGLGNIGTLAGKPVMEGKAVLFKKFAGIDVFDIEVEASGIDEFVSTVQRIAPTFGGINLEDVRPRSASRSRDAGDRPSTSPSSTTTSTGRPSSAPPRS